MKLANAIARFQRASTEENRSLLHAALLSSEVGITDGFPVVSGPDFASAFIIYADHERTSRDFPAMNLVAIASVDLLSMAFENGCGFFLQHLTSDIECAVYIRRDEVQNVIADHRAT